MVVRSLWKDEGLKMVRKDYKYRCRVTESGEGVREGRDCRSETSVGSRDGLTVKVIADKKRRRSTANNQVRQRMPERTEQKMKEKGLVHVVC